MAEQIPSGSCLICGVNKPWTIWHAKDGEPTIGACEKCRSARSERDQAILREKDWMKQALYYENWIQGVRDDKSLEKRLRDEAAAALSPWQCRP